MAQQGKRTGPAEGFSCSGFWWDPKRPDERWPGTLTFDPTGGGTLARMLEPDPRRLFSLEDTETYDLVHGTTTEGLKVTLIDAFEQRGDDLFANAVVTGGHLDGRDPLVTNVAAVIDNLDEWWDKHGMSADSSRFPSVDASYRQPEPAEIYADDSVRIAIHCGLGASVERRRVSIEEEVRIEIKAVVPQRLSLLRRHIHVCQDFMSVASAAVCTVKELRFVEPVPEGERETVSLYHAVPIHKPRPGRSADFLFLSRDLSGHLRDAFTSWLSAAESLTAIRSLYMAAVHGKGFLEVKLLSLAQAVEGFHRWECNGQDRYMEQAAYERDVLPSLIAAIPGTLDRSHRDALKTRLTYGTDYSLRRRLTAVP
ncbi:MAG: hypothetical protein ABMA15_07785 [Vicinamibacterales bacterium]